MKVTQINDTHFPFQDDECVETILAHIKLFKPDYVMLCGDIIDMYSMSRFGKDPKKRILKEELDMTNEFLDNLQKAMPKKCSAIYMYGNHEKRLEKYIESKAPELDGLLSLAEFLHLEKRGIDYRHYGKWLELDNVVYMHGEKLGVKSGYAAHRQMMRVGKTMAMGHTHRLALVHYTDWRGTYRAVEGGCLCQLDPDYVDGVADWQHGFVDWIDGVPTLHDFL